MAETSSAADADGAAPAAPGAQPAAGQSTQGPQGPRPAVVDPADQANAAWWCSHFGVTVAQLEEAVQAAGNDPGAVQEQLLNQGGSAGVG